MIKSVFKPRFNTKEDYGSNWIDLSKQCKERDNYTCRRCGYNQKTDKEHRNLHAHHIVPLPQGPNTLKNLKTLCEKCHTDIHPHMRKKVSFKTLAKKRKK